MVVFDMRDVCQSITVKNPTNRAGVVDFETDDGRWKRVIVESRQTIRIGITAKRYVTATASPGIQLEGK